MHGFFFPFLSLGAVLVSSSADATPIVKASGGGGAGVKGHNANHIFNAIHSSMRQWGSSLNHNGMSFFMATVPAGTQLYHGTSKKEVVTGMEWLAFEPEHALVFARPRGPPGGGPPGGRRPDHGDEEGERRHGFHEEFEDEREEDCNPAYDDPWSRQGHAHTPPPPDLNAPSRPDHPHAPPEHGHLSPPPGPPHRRPPPHNDSRPRPPPPPPPHHGGHPPPDHHRGPPPPPPSHHEKPPPPPPHDRKSQQTLPPNIPSPSPPNTKGYLHTYIPARPLHLLYLDGLSAGKTSNGTLDTQDMLLLRHSTSPGGPMGGERARAQALCDIAGSAWEGRADGFLRMEAGFEIILCEFEGAVERKSVVGVEEVERGGVMGGWRYVEAVAERYHGIGGGRVEVDYEGFVSVFAFDGEDGEADMGLWENDVVSDTRHPRLVNAPPEQLEKVRDAVTEMVVRSGERKEDGRDWQAVADMVVKRYSAALHYLHTDASVRRSKEAFAAYLNALLRPFISPSERNSTLETERCIAQFIPPFPISQEPPSLAHTTLHAVTAHICSSLLNALDASTLTLSRSLAATSSPPYHALDLIDNLVDYLQWTTWKECGPCADEEVCFIPIWPMGSLENHKTPKCVQEDGVGTGYWGRWGPPRGDRPGEEHPTNDDPAEGHQRPERLELRKGPHESEFPPPPRGGWEHGREGRTRYGGRRKSGRCGSRGHRHPPAHPSRHGGYWPSWRGWGVYWAVWNRLKANTMWVVEWF